MNFDWRSMTAAVVFACGLPGCGGGGGSGGATGGQAAATFAPAGPAAVMRAASQDAAGSSYTVYYPSTLHSDGVLNPVIAYGNGTYAVCTTGLSEAFGRHLASWGYVVVCPDHSHTGFGTQVLEAARFMVAENARVGSEFHGRLDIDAIGSAGHSQGATGALNANAQSGGLIKTTVTFAFVDPEHHGQDQPPLGRVSGPVLLLSGCADTFTRLQDPYFDQLATPTAKACRSGAGHVDMFRPGLVYAAAWFHYVLRGDAVARTAFVATGGVEPEMATDPDWSGWRSKGLR
jgi:hypothetical protein